ncbi:MAG: aminoglycoside phosphotransferase family protein [Anaerolineae bacterium]|nr:aminoglycoside phosphotransferase family protein [Anaerolineae bacterium]
MNLETQQIVELVHQVFPDADVVSSQRFRGEHSNANYDLQLAAPASSIVLKIYSSDLDGHSAGKETRLLSLLTSETGVPVPRVLHFDDRGDLVSAPWALHARLPGQPLSEVIDTLDDPGLESVGYEMGRYLSRLHQIPLGEFGELFRSGPQNHPTEKGYVIAQATRWLEQCAEGGLLATATIDALDHLFVQTRLLTRRQACLIHGEYVTENTIVERGISGYHVTGVLEFAYAQAGSPELDMSTLFLREMERLPAFQKGFLDGYAESGELVRHFWGRLRLYQMFACLRGITAAHRSGQSQREQAYGAWIVDHLDPLDSAWSTAVQQP